MTPISYICSKYHPWFRSMNYPQLDIHKYDDGEWALIEYYRTPVVPCLTPWRAVLSGLRHIEISRGFVEKYIAETDLTRKQAWAKHEADTQRMLEEKDALERAAYDRVDAAHNVIRHNPDLMDRIAKHGLGEMNLDKIARHVPDAELAAQRRSYNAQI